MSIPLTESKIMRTLRELGLCADDDIRPFHPRVRDREDIAAVQSMSSGIVFLSSLEHIDQNYYKDKEGLSYYGHLNVNDLQKAKDVARADDQRRADQFRSLINGKIWMDVGTYAGGVLDLLKPAAERVCAVEPQRDMCRMLKESGYEVYQSVDDYPRSDLEVVSLFHVFEHVHDPLGILQSLYAKMAPGGTLIVEVPHARDILFRLESFRDFSLWSEHLILHTKFSLQRFLTQAGFQNVRVDGYQRYGLANHLQWWFEGKPGGHQMGARLNKGWLDRWYTQKLMASDQTDTIIGYATK